MDAFTPKGGKDVWLTRDQLTQARHEAAEIPWYDRDDVALVVRQHALAIN